MRSVGFFVHSLIRSLRGLSAVARVPGLSASSPGQLGSSAAKSRSKPTRTSIRPYSGWLRLQVSIGYASALLLDELPPTNDPTHTAAAQASVTAME